MHECQHHFFRIYQRSNRWSEVLHRSAQNVRVRIFYLEALSLVLVPMLALTIIVVSTLASDICQAGDAELDGTLGLMPTDEPGSGDAPTLAADGMSSCAAILTKAGE